MKVKKLLVGLGLCGMAMFLSACASFGNKFETPSDEFLVLGKLTPAEAFKHLGEPFGKSTKATKDGAYLTYRYDFVHNTFGTVSSRELRLEFKENTLNGYYWWSSFEEDKTTVNEDAFSRLQAGIGKLSRTDVLALAGKPNGKAHCPTGILEFKNSCEKNTEAWGWYMQEKINVGTAKSPKNMELIVTFDPEGKASSVETTEFNNWQRTGY